MGVHVLPLRLLFSAVNVASASQGLLSDDCGQQHDADPLERTLEVAIRLPHWHFSNFSSAKLDTYEISITSI